MAFLKTIDLTDDFCLDKSKGETRISPLLYTTANHGFEQDDRISKTATSEEALEFASHIQPIPGARVILVSAMGSSDAWGVNKKGDSFPEAGLLGKLPIDITSSMFDKYRDRLPKEWGISLYPTKFNKQGEQIGGGNTFHEHKNKPARLHSGLFVNRPGSDERCGDILAVFWNPRMSRVEIIQSVWENKLPHICKMIDEGFLPGISMACDVPFDRCSICGNLAVNDGTYCSHLNRITGHRGGLFGDKLISMINDFPLLFDSSIVAHPAAVEGRTLKKIASMGGNFLPQNVYGSSTRSTNTSASVPPPQQVQKNASIWLKLKQDEPVFPSYVLDHFRKQGLGKSASSLAFFGISFTGPEIASILFPYSKTANLSGILADHVYPAVLYQKVKLVQPTASPIISDILEGFSKAANIIDPHSVAFTGKTIAPWFHDRSELPAIIGNRVGALSSPSRIIDLNQPLHNLSDETKAILLARVLSDSAIVAQIHNVLVKPAVMWEIQKLGLSNLLGKPGIHKDPAQHVDDNEGLLTTVHQDYIKDINLARNMFFAAHPGNS